MSVEEFFGTYPVDSVFVDEMSRRPEYRDHSPVALIANILLKEGHDGIRNAGRRIQTASVQPDPTLAKLVNQQVGLNKAAIYLGASVLAIEGMLRNGTLDKKSFNALVNNAFENSGLVSNTFELSPKIKGLDTPEVSERELKIVLSTAMGDKTFGDFFNNDFINMPFALRSHIRTTDLASYADFIVPEFTKRAELIIDERQREKMAAHFRTGEIILWTNSSANSTPQME